MALVSVMSYARNLEQIVSSVSSTNIKDSFVINASSLSNTLWGLTNGKDSLTFKIKYWTTESTVTSADARFETFTIEVRNKCYGLTVGTISLDLTAAQKYVYVGSTLTASYTGFNAVNADCPVVPNIKVTNT